MSAWTPADLAAIGRAEELEVSSRRTDGTLRPFVTIWVVRAGEDVVIRSARGPENGWFRRAAASGTGRVRAGGVEADVAFEAVPPGAVEHAAIDAGYHAKYDRYGQAIVGSVVGRQAELATLRVVRLAA